MSTQPQKQNGAPLPRPAPMQQQVLAPPSRMVLTNVSHGKQEVPRRVFLYSPEGVGKTTFGAGAPKPIFIAAEAGTAQLDIARFPKPESWAEVLAAVRTLTNETHDYKTLVFDTMDAIEPLLWAHMCKRDSNPKRTLRDVEDYGFGKGHEKALDDWRVLLKMLELLCEAKRMNVVFLAHSWIKAFKDPESDGYDRYQMKLNAKAAGLLKEWCDAVLFANHESYAHKDENTKRVRGYATGARIMHTNHTAAYDAKNRYGLPDELPLSWADFDAAATAGQVAEPERLRQEIKSKAQQLGGDLEKIILETVNKAGDNTQSLAVINNRVTAKLGELAQKEE